MKIYLIKIWFNLKFLLLKIIKKCFPGYFRTVNANKLLQKVIDLSKISVKKKDFFDDFSLLIMIIGILIDDADQSKFKTTIITGYPRVGKSILSVNLANTLNGTLLRTDTLRNIYWEIEDDDRRQEVRENLYEEILTNYPYNLIIEGDDFISKNRSANSTLKPYSLDFISRLKNTYNIEVCVIGNKETSVIDKVSGLEEFREKGNCWTLNNNKYNKNKNLQKIAKASIEASKSLWYLAEKNDAIYFELRTSKFHEDISAAIDKISKKINIVN